MNNLKLADNSYRSADGKILIGVPRRTGAEAWVQSVDTKPEYLVLFGSENDRECETFWFAGNRLEGAVLLRSPEKTADASAAVTAHARYEELF